MDVGFLVKSENVSRPTILSREITTSKQVSDSFVEEWLNNHFSLVVLIVLAAGFGCRLWAASGRYLNPNEALHYILSNEPTVLVAYKASMTQAHPPLFILILYLWHFLGRSEFMLRMPSILAGTAFCWFTLKWTGLFFGKRAGLIAMVMATFSPATIELSAEVRQYALLLFGVAAALYFLGRAFEEKSSRDVRFF